LTINQTQPDERVVSDFPLPTCRGCIQSYLNVKMPKITNELRPARDLLPYAVFKVLV